MTKNKDILIAKLNLETAKIPWHELQRFFAQGKVLMVDADQDLVTTAGHIAADQADVIDSLVKASTLKLVTDEQAKDMIEHDSQVWAVVIAPWVLIQQISESPD